MTRRTNEELAALLDERADSSAARDTAEPDDDESYEFWIDVDREAAAALREAAPA